MMTCSERMKCTLYSCIFSPIGKFADRAIIFYLPFLFFKLSKASSGTSGRIFTIFLTKWKVFAWMLSTRTSFHRFLKGRCHDNQIWAKFAKWPSFSTLAFENGLEYRNMDKQLYSANDPSISPTNMVNFGPVTPQIEVWEICTFDTAKNGLSHRISQQLLNRSSSTFQLW